MLGINVAISDNRGFAAFHMAAEHGSLSVLNFLFAHVPILTSKIHDAIENSQFVNAQEAAKTQDGRPRRRKEKTHRPPLIAQRRRLTLGSHVASIISAQTNEGTTALDLASQNNHYAVVDRLNTALLLEKVPWMPEANLILQCATYGE